jgi:hypothetical protein
MRRFALALASISLLGLAACKPVASTDTSGDRVMAGKGIMVRFEQTTTEDAQSVPTTKATLHVTGVVEKDIDLGSLQGALTYVDPSKYPVYAEQENKPETVAMFSNWFAGAGQEVSVQIHNQTLIVTSREGDEGGECTHPKELARVALGKDVVVEWENLPAKSDASSLAFCK